MRRLLLGLLLFGVALMPGLHYPGVPPVGGGGAEEIFNLTSAPEGGWTAPQYPKAIYYNGYTYFAWINGSTGALKVASYNHSTEVTSTAIQIDSMGADVDDHNNPGLLVRDSDKKLLLAFSLHGGPSMFLITSTNSLTSDPTMTGGFGAAVNLDSSIGGNHYTYPSLIQLTGVASDPIYLFYRDQNSSTGRLAYTKSTDGGSTWSARTLVFTAASTNRGYWALASDFNSRIDVMSTDRDAYGSEGTVDVGHMYLDGTTDKWYTSAGVEIVAAKPFAHSEMTQLETNVDGAFAVDGLSSANPVFTYFVDAGSSVTAKWARWDGATWDKNSIYVASHLPLDRFYGYLSLNRADTDELFSGVSTGGTTSELYSYVTADSGATWTGTALTAGSGDYNVAAIPVHNGVSTMPVMWLRGTFTSSFDFNWAIKGLRR
jgi:hypothetical protein